MAKLKNIIRQLSKQDYESIHNQLMVSGADKSAYLLEAMRSNQVGDYKIVHKLGVNSNAYYTLRSRLGHKIEQYLLDQISSPRTNLLRKVANLHEIVFGNLKSVAIATLKSLEKELQEYDLPTELMQVCKYLRQLHANESLEYEYGKRYNKHMAAMVALDKAEHLLFDYAKSYANYFLEGQDNDQHALVVIKENVQELSSMFTSHRLQVHEGLLLLFDGLFFQTGPRIEQESLEDLFDRVERIFELYPEDPLYPHFAPLLDFLRYGNHCRNNAVEKAQEIAVRIQPAYPMILERYSAYAFSGQVLFLQLEEAIKTGTAHRLHAENELLFKQYVPNENDIATYLCYHAYHGVCGYYAGEESVLGYHVSQILNNISLKNYPRAYSEVKALVALHYTLQGDYGAFLQTCNSLQRKLRLLGEQSPNHLVVLVKLLKTVFNPTHRTKKARLEELFNQLELENYPLFSPLRFITLDPQFLDRLNRVHAR